MSSFLLQRFFSQGLRCYQCPLLTLTRDMWKQLCFSWQNSKVLPTGQAQLHNELSIPTIYRESNQHRLTPHQPWDTLCYMCQLQYRIVHTDNELVFSDFVEFFSAPQGLSLDTTSVTMSLRCYYAGTYLLRVFNDIVNSGLPGNHLLQRCNSNHTQVPQPRLQLAQH